MLPGWARRRRRAEGWGAFAELCSSVPGARRPCRRRWSTRGRYCRRRRRRRRRSMTAPAPRPLRVPSPPARVPGERWSGVGPVCLPPAPSPESRSPTERKGEGVSGGGGGLERPRGGAYGDCHPAICLGGGAGAHTARSASPGGSPAGAQGGAAGERPTTSPSTAPLGEFRSIGGERALAAGGGEENSSGTRNPGPLASPRAPPAPQRPRGPVAPASRSQPRRLCGRGDRRGLGAGSRAQHCHYLTQQEQCWGELRAETRNVIGSRKWVLFFFFNLVITFHFQGFIFFC